MPNFIALEYISFLGQNFPGMRRLILILMSNVLFGRNIDFHGGYLVVTGDYYLLTGGYCLLLLVTAYFHF